MSYKRLKRCTYCCNSVILASALRPVSILWRVSVHVALFGVTYSSDGRLFSISCRWMSHICTKEDHWLLEHQRPKVLTEGKFSIKNCISRFAFSLFCCNISKVPFKYIWQFHHQCLHQPALWEEDVIDAAQLDVDLQTEVGEGLRCCLLNILHLHTLRGHAKYRVPNTFHLSCNTQQDDKRTVLTHDQLQYSCFMFWVPVVVHCSGS